MKNLKIAIAVFAFTLSNAFSFGIGMYFRSPAPVTEKVQDADAQVAIDSLIAAWVDERTVVVAQMGMVDESGMFRVGTFPDTVRELAKSVFEAYQVPVAVTLAQFALESRFGTRHMNANNFFGHTLPVALKYATPPQRFVSIPTREFIGGKEKILTRKFAKYASMEEAFTVHGRLLFNGYSSAQRFKHDPVQFARAIGTRYATDPDYALKLITIMKRYRL